MLINYFVAYTSSYGPAMGFIAVCDNPDRYWRQRYLSYGLTQCSWIVPGTITE